MPHDILICKVLDLPKIHFACGLKTSHAWQDSKVILLVSSVPANAFQGNREKRALCWKVSETWSPPFWRKKPHHAVAHTVASVLCTSHKLQSTFWPPSHFYLLGSTIQRLFGVFGARAETKCTVFLATHSLAGSFAVKMGHQSFLCCICLLSIRVDQMIILPKETCSA